MGLQYQAERRIDLPGEVSAIEVPELASLLNSEGLGDLNDNIAGLLGGEMGDLGSVFAHPFLERVAEVGLSPA